MARWQPGTRGRLQAVALQLFAEQGYDRTTVAEIAGAAEVTERTFFRHFADKPEVLFAGQDGFLALFVDSITAAAEDTPPFDLIRLALDASADFFPEDRRAWSRTRQEIIDANAALGERELGKLATLKARLGEVLRGRGVPEPVATMAAETTVTVFHLSFAQWIAPDEDRPFATIAAERLDALTSLVQPGR
ncbi:TetR/AcrR family transcriptional regulator [Curtobacterium sp. MCPF17_021]|uniref:TetR/AcrR family transcriptional regulator n=1 Tax=Curtobacterium sp. MCPF17_021 TaxID=2175639 RepID=UPI000DA846D4|nr:TetR/AcrR family transcriptional regulator [Curtobacterium sp. MCPF17_021]WIE82566.1 helix-turn-helix domain-containing protein [Curtobacterium sp. MCPF17_021]